ncbi:ABC transporter substrate-binding protein [Anaeromyxobacter sp. Fw109-5]|uniref:ABC transporter substrate-binding protein n=1 Tax=Anaeromyxobacter sp. (strain Fw109-5) TaxID=404589 RepID=UPI000158A76E|nr:helical backbone metal receptor [Anaeromyxobacter sp. Fw109-5]ABS27750.1 periplasmic binding protein [Anaeromyxobacter sp. Fw109-5]
MKITSPLLGTALELPARPARIVSLVSSATETLFALGAGDAVAGVTPYCARYVPGLAAPVVADYVSAEIEAVRAVAPELVIATDGVQLPLARRLAAAGLPVALLPVPQSRFGILENTVALGALCGRLAEARSLCDALERACADLVASAPAPRPRAYAELWFGRHLRRPGGRAFVHDLLWLAGLDPVHGARPDAYAPPELDEVPRLAPEWVIVFSEPEHPIDARALVRERGWDRAFAPRVLASSTDRGRNLIHDGPSFVETARWLRGAISP